MLHLAIPPDANTIIFTQEIDTHLCTFLNLDFDQPFSSSLPDAFSAPGILVKMKYAQAVWLKILPAPDKRVLPVSHFYSNYQNTEIYILKENVEPEIFWTVEDQVLLVGTSALAIEKGIYQLKNGHPWVPLDTYRKEVKDIWISPDGDSGYFSDELWETKNSFSNEDSNCHFFQQTIPLFKSREIQYELNALLRLVPANCYKLQRNVKYWYNLQLSKSDSLEIKITPEQESGLEVYDLLLVEPYLNYELNQYLHPSTGSIWSVDLEGFTFQCVKNQQLKSLLNHYLAGSVLSNTLTYQNLLESENGIDILEDYRKEHGNSKWLYEANGFICGFLCEENIESSLRNLFNFEMQEDGSEGLWFLPELEILLIQDRSQLLYALNLSGNKVWSLNPNNERVLSVWEVSSPTNRQKDRLLIQTENALFRYIPGEKNSFKTLYTFPEKAKIKATVYQFEALGAHHIFIPFPSGKIIGVDQEGKFLPGWEQGVLSGKTDFPILHFKWAKSDYNMVLDQEGKLWAFDRFGKLHWGPTYMGIGLTPLQVFLSPTQQRIAFIDSTSAIRVSNLDGESFGLRIPVNPPIIDFKLNPFNQSSNPVYQILDQTKLIDAGYNQNSFETIKSQFVTPGTSMVYTTEMTGDIIGYWINERKILSLEQGLGNIQFDHKSLFIPFEDGYLLVGYSGNRVQGYKVFF